MRTDATARRPAVVIVPGRDETSAAWAAAAARIARASGAQVETVASLPPTAPATGPGRWLAVAAAVRTTIDGLARHGASPILVIGSRSGGPIAGQAFADGAFRAGASAAAPAPCALVELDPSDGDLEEDGPVGISVLDVPTWVVYDHAGATSDGDAQPGAAGDQVAAMAGVVSFVQTFAAPSLEVPSAFRDGSVESAVLTRALARCAGHDPGTPAAGRPPDPGTEDATATAAATA